MTIDRPLHSQPPRARDARKESIMTISTLFAATNEATTISNRGLEGTAQLTSIASVIAANIFNEARTASQDGDNDAIQQIGASMTDMSVLDKIVDNGVTPDDYESADFLKAIVETQLEQMLKSQQSKRSRCKAKAMTEDNYKSMLTAAIAEHFIRWALGKDKQSVGRGAGNGSVSYTDEQLEKFANDQEDLRRELRNVQSKKSIMKSKADFDENSDRWQALLVAEQQLKERRVTVSGRVKTEVVDTTKVYLQEMLAEVDPQSMKAADLKELLGAIKDYVFDITDDDELDTDAM